MQTTSLPFSFALVTLACAIPAQWSDTSPASSPPGRVSHAMAFDSVRNEVVVFGGAGVGGPWVGDTWTYDGTSWTQKIREVAPTARGDHRMVFDSTRGVTVLYGGADAFVSDQTWEWNGTSWNRIITFASAGARMNHMLAYDSVRQRVVMFGGLTSNQTFTPTDDTWEYDGISWNQVMPANSPPRREHAAMCYHAGIGKVVLYGGLDANIGLYGDTWTFDGTTWTELGIAGPGLRSAPQMVYDPVRDVCVMTGGQDGFGGMIQNTWEFDGTSWSQRPSSIGQGRAIMGMAMDTARRRVVVFGGRDNFITYNPLDTTFEYGAQVEDFGAGCVGSNGTPTITTSSVPRIGESYDVDFSNLNPNAGNVLLAVSTNTATSAFGPLPADLTFAGLTGCTLYQGLDVVLSVAASAGTAAYTIDIPNHPIFFDVAFYMQAFSIDLGHNPRSLVLTNSIKSVIGV